MTWKSNREDCRLEKGQGREWDDVRKVKAVSSRLSQFT